ncbi:MAG: 4Fe-4S single cluster domain-containing protein [Aeromicrobium sp.]|uniref:4Fe-4S single cluster domain-containing protein n=1 Tax=Aeromicrobium sp. TaxID=1871063 RepID=UPI0039E44167
MVAAAELSVHRLAAPITSLGPGRRAGLWVQGCSIGCAGCASTDTWDGADGQRLPVSTLARQVADLLDGEALDGLTISGGEPFQQADALADCLDLLRAAGALADRDVLVFTGYAAPRARRLSTRLWEHADAVVAGPYRADQPGDGWLRASGNQQLLHLTPLGHERFVDPERATTVNVTVSGGSLVMAGLPAAGDLDRFRAEMSRRGIDFPEVSWQS